MSSSDIFFNTFNNFRTLVLIGDKNSNSINLFLAPMFQAILSEEATSTERKTTFALKYKMVFLEKQTFGIFNLYVCRRKNKKKLKEDFFPWSLFCH